MAAPWLKFYPTDWQSDPALRMCSLAARGLWQEMLCIMHKATPYGSLVVNGKQIPPKQLAVLVGAPQREVEACLVELEAAGVPSRDKDGTIYSRRMRRDYEKAEKDKSNGRGGGNPNLKAQPPDGVNPPKRKRTERGLTPPLTPTPGGGDKAQSQNPETRDPEGTQNHQHPSETEAAREGATKSLISPEAHSIAEELAKEAGFTKETWPPGWCGAAMAVQKWLNDGCPGEVVKLAVTTALQRRKRDGPPDNFAYFAKPIAAAFADHQRPNPAAPPQAFDGKSNGNAPRKRTPVDAGKDLMAEYDARIAAAEAREAGERAGDPPARLLPPERCN